MPNTPKANFKDWVTITTVKGKVSLPGTLVRDLKEIINKYQDMCQFDRLFEFQVELEEHLMSRDNPHSLIPEVMANSILDSVKNIWDEYGYVGTVEDVARTIFHYIEYASIEDMKVGTAENLATPVNVFDYAFRTVHNEGTENIHTPVIDRLFPGNFIHIMPEFSTKASLYAPRRMFCARDSSIARLNKCYEWADTPPHSLEVDMSVPEGGFPIFPEVESFSDAFNDYTHHTWEKFGVSTSGTEVKEFSGEGVHILGKEYIFPEPTRPTLQFTVHSSSCDHALMVYRDDLEAWEDIALFNSKAIVLTKSGYDVEYRPLGGKSQFRVSHRSHVNSVHYGFATLSDQGEFSFGGTRRTYHLENVFVSNSKGFTPHFETGIRSSSSVSMDLPEWNKTEGTLFVQRDTPPVSGNNSPFEIASIVGDSGRISIAITGNEVRVSHTEGENNEIHAFPIPPITSSRTYVGFSYNSGEFSININTTEHSYSSSVATAIASPSLFFSGDFDGYLCSLEYFSKELRGEKKNFSTTP